MKPCYIFFNLILDVGILPDDLKQAKVTPIYKQDDKNECGNYRPISVIPAISKMLEKIIYNQLLNFLNDNKIIKKRQSGFRKYHSTETALLQTTNEYLMNMDRDLINGVLFLDLKKAFDTVDHKILLAKLELYGVQGVALNFFKSYLTNRSQLCTVQGTNSQLKKIRCGVPQGSNVGPLLFSLYINDLPNCLEQTEASMFADDTNISSIGNSPADIEVKLNNDLYNVNNSWLIANKLTLNVKKTEFMLIASKRKLKQFSYDPCILIGNHNIKQVTNKKVLGITLDDELRWHKHNDLQCKKLSKSIALLRRSKRFVNQNVLTNMYNSLVLPQFTYCSNVWNDGSRTHTDKLLKMQKRADRIITGSTYEVRSKDIFNILHWEPIETTLKKREMIMTFKALQGQLPECMTNFFKICLNDMYPLSSAEAFKEYKIRRN